MTASGALFATTNSAHAGALSLDSQGAVFGDATTTDHPAATDSFVFSSGSGDVSLNYHAGEVIDLQQTSVTSADLLSHVHSDAGGNAVIDLGHGDSITLTGVSADEVAHDPQSFVKVH